MRRKLKKLRTWLGRISRDAQRKTGKINGHLQNKVVDVGACSSGA